MRGLRTWSGERVVGVGSYSTIVEAVVGVGVRFGALAGGTQVFHIEVVFEVRDVSTAAGLQGIVLGDTVAARRGAAVGLERFETFLHALWS